jgi:tRNA nucleotidyltransferase/poly(A) polymerase
MRSPVRDVAAFALERGAPVYLVGGAVRDGILRRPITDWDFALESGEERLARWLEGRGWGRAFPLSGEGSPFPVWRVACRGGSIDIARFERPGGISADLERRDFTVNAMALDVNRRVLVDPFGARSDLAAGRLRAVSGRNLEDDPLRVLRAYRLAARRGWRIVPATRRLLSRAVPGIDRVAGERVHAEIVAILEARSPAAAWAQAATDGALTVLFGVAAARALAGARALAPLDGRNRPPVAAADRLALFLFRAGVLPADARSALERWRFSREERRDVESGIALLSEAFSEEDPRRVAFRYRDRPGAGRLLAAAARGRSEIRRAGEIIRALGRGVSGPLPVDGRDVARWLDLAPGPQIGRALEEAAFRHYLGQWTTPDQIRRGLRSGESVDPPRSRRYS